MKRGIDVFERCLRFAGERLLATVEAIQDSTRYPVEAHPDDKWMTAEAAHWTSGFFPGCLWYMYELTGLEAWREHAQAWTANLKDQKHNTGTHDLGFMMFCSFGTGYRLTGNPEYKNIILESAESLAERYKPEPGCIRSWGEIDDNDTFLVIIDNMMNLELLFWAAKNGGPENLYDMAVSHALRTMEHQVRDDGSTVHIIDYDVATSTPRDPDPTMIHGVGQDSCWSRGLAWALYGYTVTYRETRDERFLNTAEQIAGYFLTNLPPDNVPYWDFQAPNVPRERRDVSSAAIGASALLELSTLTQDSRRREKYFKRAEAILVSISLPPYLVESQSNYAILQHAAYGHPDADAKCPNGISLIFADYYFLEALLRHKNMLQA